MLALPLRSRGQGVGNILVVDQRVRAELENGCHAFSPTTMLRGRAHTNAVNIHLSRLVLRLHDRHLLGARIQLGRRVELAQFMLEGLQRRWILANPGQSVPVGGNMDMNIHPKSFIGFHRIPSAPWPCRLAEFLSVKRSRRSIQPRTSMTPITLGPTGQTLRGTAVPTPIGVRRRRHQALQEGTRLMPEQGMNSVLRYSPPRDLRSR